MKKVMGSIGAAGACVAALLTAGVPASAGPPASPTITPVLGGLIVAFTETMTIHFFGADTVQIVVWGLLLGMLLARSRYLFIGMHRARFAEPAAVVVGLVQAGHFEHDWRAVIHGPFVQPQCRHARRQVELARHQWHRQVKQLPQVRRGVARDFRLHRD